MVTCKWIYVNSMFKLNLSKTRLWFWQNVSESDLEMSEKRALRPFAKSEVRKMLLSQLDEIVSSCNLRQTFPAPKANGKLPNLSRNRCSNLHAVLQVVFSSRTYQFRSRSGMQNMQKSSRFQSGARKKTTQASWVWMYFSESPEWSKYSPVATTTARGKKSVHCYLNW